MKKLLAPFTNKVLWNLSNFIMKRRYDIACVDAKARLSALLPRVAKTMSQQRAGGGLHHKFSELKLLELGEFLWLHRPKTILELGGGGTTAVLAEYAATFSDVKVVSVDESSDYLNLTRERIDSELRDNITFMHCSRKEEDGLGGVRTCYYEDTWKQAFSDATVDIVYVDGPTAATNTGIKIPCVDAARMVDDDWEVGHVLFDVRIASVKYCVASGKFASHLLHLHRNAQNPVDEPWVVDNLRHHSWFEPSPIRLI